MPPAFRADGVSSFRRRLTEAVEAKEAEREARRDKDREFLADYAAERVGGPDNHKRIAQIIGTIMAIDSGVCDE